MSRLSIVKSEPLKSLSRIRIGGEAEYFASVANIAALLDALRFAKDKSLPIYLIGAGTNLLIDDGIINGLTLKLGGRLNCIEFDEERGTVTAGAATPLMTLGYHIARRGYGGFEFMGVIPGSVGGAVCMNAGTSREGEIKDHFLSARILDSNTFETITYDRGMMRFTPRQSVLTDWPGIVIDATFRLDRNQLGDSAQIVRSIRDLHASRKQKFPGNPRTFGSTFKRPEGGRPPGWYLEQVGMKGYRAGDALVPEAHANWIVNIGQARSEDVKTVIRTGLERVYNAFGIRLSREVVFLPKDFTC